MFETNAKRAAEIAAKYIRTIDPVYRAAVQEITAALDEAERRGLEEASTTADRLSDEFDEEYHQNYDPYIQGKALGADACVEAIRALLDPRHAAQPEGDR